MNHHVFKAFICLFLIVAANNLTTKAADPVVWDIATGSLIISGISTDHYIVTGTTTSNFVVVETGYRGVITLQNLNISITGNRAPITIKGQDNCSNLTPVTIVDIILEGNNTLRYTSGTGLVCMWRWEPECVKWGENEWVPNMVEECIEWGEEKEWVPNMVWECVEWGEEEWVPNMVWECVEWEKVEIDGDLVDVCVKTELVDYGQWERPCVKTELVDHGWWYEPCVETEWVDYGWWTQMCEEFEDVWKEVCWWEWGDGHAAFHVDQGAQINISAINPSDHASGTLSAISTGSGGAGIGASRNDVPQATATAAILGGCPSPANTAGGNIVISSGTVTAQGGEHAAGIGGGWHSYYDGMIVIYGGKVKSDATFHAAGIGSGCPTASGVVPCYSPNGAVIVLPPAQIEAMGAGNREQGIRADLALGGAFNIVYIGDPAKPIVTVRTVDYEPNANIYVDLSESPNIAKVINAIVPADRLDINKVQFGSAGSDGIFQFHGIINDNTTFFTDATSSQPATLGRPYQPKTVQLPEGETVNRMVILELLETEMSIEAIPSIPLIVGYTASEALTNAFRIKITYSDVFPLHNLVFDLAGGAISDFSTTGIKFYSSDGVTEIPILASLYNGDIIYIAIPLQIGKPTDNYEDVFRFIGTWNGRSTGYIRIVITQYVGTPVIVSTVAAPAAGGTTSGSGRYAATTGVTVTATPNTGYNFVNWTVDGRAVSTEAAYSFEAAEDVELTANFVLKTYTVSVSASPAAGGTVSGGGTYSHGDPVTVTATPNTGYNFISWTREGAVVSTNPAYPFVATEDIELTANFELKTYAVSVSASPVTGGTVSGGGIYTHGDPVTVRATAGEIYILINWTENGVEVSTDTVYTFTATDDRTLVANFAISYKINVDVNNDAYGAATGTGNYGENTTTSVEAFVNDCYRFANWTENGVEVSVDNPYLFTVTQNRNLVANFYALDFDTYAPTLWDNTFMLDLRKLAEEGYELTGCKWFKNGIEERDTRTINEYSYSAGPDITDLVETAPVQYMFQLITGNQGPLCSTEKVIANRNPLFIAPNAGDPIAYPNPLPPGGILTIEGVVGGSAIIVYNQSGSRVISTVAADSVVTLAIPVPEGIYIIYAGDKAIKIIVSN